MMLTDQRFQPFVLRIEEHGKGTCIKLAEVEGGRYASFTDDSVQKLACQTTPSSFVHSTGSADVWGWNEYIHAIHTGTLYDDGSEVA